MSGKAQQKNRPRLGRGLSSLISISEMVDIQAPPAPQPPQPPEPRQGGDVEQPATARPPEPPAHPPTPLPNEAKILPGAPPAEVALADIVPNPHQPRQHFDQAALAELPASIKSTGIIQPILVRQIGDQYQLITGERRLRAAKLAGLTTIPALIRDVDAVTQAQMALIENIQREDLNPIERAQGYRTLIEQLGLTQAELAGRLGEDRSSIANFLRLLDLAQPVQEMVRDGRLSVGHAKLIAGIDDILEQQRLAALVLEQGLSVRNLERIMKQGPKPAQQPSPAPSAHLQNMEQSLTRQLGLRVQLRSNPKGRGKLIVHYANLDEFDELLQRLGIRTEEE